MDKLKALKSVFVGAVAALTVSCNDIAEGDRLVYVPPAEVNRAVLVEDFTGQRCPNCPNASVAIEELQKQYGADTIIAVGIYSGTFGHKPNGDPLPLTTTTGDEYYSKWPIEGQPAVVFNRKSGVVYDYNGGYSPVVNAMLKEPTPVNLDMTVGFNADSTEMSVDVTALSAETVNGKLQVWVLEDGVIGPQIMPTTGETNMKYVHNHVFRTSVTKETWGDAFNITSGETAKATYKFTPDASWVKKNLSVVAFVYNDNDGVLQAVRRTVTTE